MSLCFSIPLLQTGKLRQERAGGFCKLARLAPAGGEPQLSRAAGSSPGFVPQSLSNIREASELPTAERIAECDQDITELFNALMTLEMQLAEQLEVRRAGGMGGRRCHLVPQLRAHL